MMDDKMKGFLEVWNHYLGIGAMVFLALGVLILLFHMFKLATTKDFKQKYDYINLNEINFLWYSVLCFLVAAGLYANTLVTESDLVWFIVRIFTTVSLGLILGSLFSNSLRVYYPTFVEKRLKALRFNPRKSPKTGKAMKLLSEEEEDVYLDEGMQAEENVFSVDYDVWVDEETGFTKIEKYSGHLHAEQCGECNYQTFKVTREEILEETSNSSMRELMKFYECTYCGHKGRKKFNIAELKEKSKKFNLKKGSLATS